VLVLRRQFTDVHMKFYETPALDSDVGKMDISAETSFVLMHEIL